MCERDKLVCTTLVCIAGTNVIIDRTNFDPVQRADFMKLAAELGVPAHGVMLHLDVGLCVKRAIDRTDHEGGLQVHWQRLPAVIVLLATDNTSCGWGPGGEVQGPRRWTACVMYLDVITAPHQLSSARLLLGV